MKRFGSCGTWMRVVLTAICGHVLLASAATAQANGQHKVERLIMNLNATELVPYDMRSGPNYKIADIVGNDGLVNTYQVHTLHGSFTVESTARLYQRVRELRALQQIEAIQKTGVFLDALKKAGTAPLRTAEALVLDPVDTAKGTLSGLGRWFSNAGRSITSPDPDQEGVLRNATGQAAAKRHFACEFGVNPYSSFRPLQKELDHLAWTAAAGGLTVKVALAAIPGAAGRAASLSGTAQDIQQLVRDKSPAELSRMVEGRLKKMGVSDKTARQFLANSHYNPVERLLLVGELVQMKGVQNRQVFITLACDAPSEVIALFMRIQAQFMRRYAEDHPIARLLLADGVAFMETKDGAIVGVFPLDYVMHTQILLARVARIDKDLKGFKHTGRKELLFAGTVAPEVVTALGKQGWKVKGGMLKSLGSY